MKYVLICTCAIITVFPVFSQSLAPPIEKKWHTPAFTAAAAEWSQFGEALAEIAETYSLPIERQPEFVLMNGHDKTRVVVVVPLRFLSADGYVVSGLVGLRAALDWLQPPTGDTGGETFDRTAVAVAVTRDDSWLVPYPFVFGQPTSVDPVGTGLDDFAYWSSSRLADDLPHRPAIVYVAVDRPGPLTLDLGSGDAVTPAWAARAVARLNSPNIGIAVGSPQIHDLNATTANALAVFLQRDFVAVAARSGERPEGADVTPRTTGRSIGEVVQAIVAADAAQAKTAGDASRTYAVHRFGPWTIFVDEQILAFVVPGVIALLVFTAGMYRPSRRYLRHLVSGAYSIALSVALLFLCVLGSALVVRGLLSAVNSPDLLYHHAVAVLVIRVGVAMVTFFLVFSRLQTRPFKRAGSVYSAGAIAVGVLTLVVAMFTHTRFVPELALALIATVLSSVARRPAAKLLWFALAPLGLLNTVLAVVTSGDPGAITTVLMNPVSGDLAMVAVMAPSALMVIRINAVARPNSSPTRLRRHTIVGPTVVAAGSVAVAIALGVFFVVPRYSITNPQPVVVNLINHDGFRNLEIVSPAPLGTLRLVVGTRSYQVRTQSRSLVIVMEPHPPAVAFTVFRSVYLRRETYRIDLTGPPHGATVVGLSAGMPVAFYAATPPLVRVGAGPDYRFVVPPNSPTNQRLEATLPAGHSLTTAVVALSAAEDYAMSVDREDMRIIARSTTILAARDG